MPTCGTCGVTLTWKAWPSNRARPSWLGDADGYWLDPWLRRSAYEPGKPQFDIYEHTHAPTNTTEGI